MLRLFKSVGSIVWRVFGATTAVIGFAGIPDDLTTWVTWLQPIDTGLGRWIAAIIGVAILANPSRVIEAIRLIKGQQPSVPALVLPAAGRLSVSANLEDDGGSDPSRQFRIRVQLTSGDGQVSAYAEQAIDAGGRPLDFVTLPVELHWTHHSDAVPMRLSATQAAGDTFGVCAVRMRGGRPVAFVITGSRIEPAIPRFFEENRIIWILVSVTMGEDRVARWFSFEPNPTPPMFCSARPGTPPSITV